MLKDAKSRKIGFDLDQQYILGLIADQDNSCALSDIPFTSVNKPSIDRIDSSKGYIRGNIQMLIFEVNRMKSNIDQERFIELCTSIALSKARGGKKRRKKK